MNAIIDEILQIHDAYSPIRFNHAGHLYTWGPKRAKDSIWLKSVTTVLKDYMTPFDTEYWSYWKAYQTSTLAAMKPLKLKPGADFQELRTAYEEIPKPVATPADYRKRWKDLTGMGQRTGSITHDYLECAMQGKFPVNNERYNAVIADEREITKTMIARGVHFLRTNPNLVPIKIELIVGDKDHAVAGQMDGLMYDTDIDKYVILDWKTDKKFDFHSSFGVKMKAPLDHLDVCRYNKYAMQLSIYQWLLEEHTTIDIDRRMIVWLGDRTGGKMTKAVSRTKYQVHEMPYLEEEVDLIMAKRMREINKRNKK